MFPVSSDIPARTVVQFVKGRSVHSEDFCVKNLAEGCVDIISANETYITVQ